MVTSIQILGIACRYFRKYSKQLKYDTVLLQHTTHIDTKSFDCDLLNKLKVAETIDKQSLSTNIRGNNVFIIVRGNYLIPPHHHFVTAIEMIEFGKLDNRFIWLLMCAHTTTTHTQIHTLHRLPM